MTCQYCSHPQVAHEHYRRGGADESCAVCPCPDYADPHAPRNFSIAVLVSAVFLAAIVYAVIRALG